MRPLRWRRTEVPVDERVPGLGLLGRSLGEPEMPLGEVIPRVGIEEGVLVVGAGLDVAPELLSTYWRASMSFFACDTARSFTEYDAIGHSVPILAARKHCNVARTEDGG